MQPINMIMIYFWDKKLKKKKKLHVLEANIIIIKKQHWFDVSSSKGAFLQDVFQMIAITFVSDTNYYHINGWHIFWDTLYIILIGAIYFEAPWTYPLKEDCQPNNGTPRKIKNKQRKRVLLKRMKTLNGF